jgi:hypothetical protein
MLTSKCAMKTDEKDEEAAMNHKLETQQRPYQ